MVSMSWPPGTAVTWVEYPLDCCDGCRWLDESGDDRVAPHGDETRPRLASERHGAQRTQPELLARLHHRARQEPRHGGDVLAVGLSDGVEERTGQVAEHSALHLRTAPDQLQVRHGLP